MRALKTIKVTTYHGKQEVPTKSYVGYCIRKIPTLVDGKWVDSEQDEIIFGLCNDRAQLTHMCYGQLVLGNDTWEDFAVKSKHARKFDEFHFDAGGNGYPIYIKYTELQRAMVDLGLIDSRATNYCAQSFCRHSELVHFGEQGECEKIAEETPGLITHCSCAAFIGADIDVSVQGQS